MSSTAQRPRRPRRALIAAAVVAATAVGAATIAIAQDGGDGPPDVVGVVEAGGAGASGWRDELYASDADGVALLGATDTDASGGFTLENRSSAGDATIQYVIARNGAADKLLAVLGPPDEIPSTVVVNELATVASVWTSAQFINDDLIEGNATGLRAAARNVPNLVDLETGSFGAVVQNSVNGIRTNTMATMGTLASIVADCLGADCSATLFAQATPPGGIAPTNTMGALHNIARNPWNNVTEIFALIDPGSSGAQTPTFIPTLLYPPSSWTLSLVYTEGGFSAPGGLSIDADGNVWANNNFLPGSQSRLLDVGNNVLVPDPIAFSGTGVVKLTSNGEPLSPPTGFLGGGTFGAAFGMMIDDEGNAWVGNFAGDSLTELAADGTPISPSASSPYSSDGGYRDPNFASPQSVILTAAGDIWVSNIQGNTVSQLVGGDPTNIVTWGGGSCTEQFSNPWGLASDAVGRVYATNLSGRSVSMIDPSTAPGDTCPSATYPLHGTATPQGIAVDSQGNLWVADTYGGGDVSFLDAGSGYAATRYNADATTVGPWGIAVDGADNVWVADFFGKRIINLCGVSRNCPQGVAAGGRISPAGRPGSSEAGNGGGYGANATLQSMTSIVIDQAGNVWLANNFDNDVVCLTTEGIPPNDGRGSTVGEERLQTECSGNGAVVVLGAAAPVGAPIIGPPRQP